MKVWLFKLGEQTPLDKGSPKLSRTAMLAQEFSESGHEVDWFMSTFDHLTKKQRFKRDQYLEVAENYRIHMLYTPGYKKNVSFKRFRDHEIFDRRLEKELKVRNTPDVIVAAYPTIGACKILIDYATKYDVPIFIDIRDMWPDIFAVYMPKFSQFTYRFIFRKQISAAKHVLSKANGLVAITEDFLQWALKYAGRERNMNDYVAPLAYTPSVRPKTREDDDDQSVFWARQGITEHDKVICFFGVMSRKIDLMAVASAMPSLNQLYPNLKLVLCGTGDELAEIKVLFKGCDNVIFPGWVNKDQIAALMELSTFGLAPYVSERPDFLMSVPTKIIEYFSGSLPVLTSLKGVSLRIVEQSECGSFFDTPESFAKAVVMRLNSPSKLQREGLNARGVYEDEFAGATVYKRLVKHIEGVVNELTSCL